MATLKELLAALAQSPERLGQFILNPDAVMAEAKLSDEDKQALRSGFAGFIYARLLGASVEEFAGSVAPPLGGTPPPPVIIDRVKELLAALAQDPERLGQFILNPDAVMAEAKLSDEDKQALRSGFVRPRPGS